MKYFKQTTTNPESGFAIPIVIGVILFFAAGITLIIAPRDMFFEKEITTPKERKAVKKYDYKHKECVGGYLYTISDNRITLRMKDGKPVECNEKE